MSAVRQCWCCGSWAGRYFTLIDPGDDEDAAQHICTGCGPHVTLKADGTLYAAPCPDAPPVFRRIDRRPWELLRGGAG